MRLPAAFLNLVLRLVAKPALARMRDAQEIRRRLEKDARLMFRDPPGARYSDAGAPGGVASIWAEAEGSGTAPGVMLYLHGGAYIAGSPRTHRHLAASLAAAAGVRALVPDYRLAPETPLPGALDDALAVYRSIVAGAAPEPVFIAGDSAGGGLAMGLLAEILRLGLPVPAGLAAFSPWCDMTMRAASLRENARADAMLPVARMEEVVGLCVGGGDPADPRISPVLARIPGAPPAILFASRTEILRDDAVAMAVRLRDGGGTAELVLRPGLPHAWPIFRGLLAEADEDIARAGAFLRAAGARAVT